MKKNIYILYIIEFLSSFYMVNVIQTLFFENRGMRLHEIGIILATYQITKSLFEIPTGIIADKYGKKLSCVIGFSLFEVFLLICYFSTNIELFVLSAIFQGISYTFLSGAIDSLFVDTIISCGEKNKLDKYNSLNRALFYISIGLSSLSGGYIALKSYNLVFIITICIQLIPILLLFFVDEPKLLNTDISNKNSAIKISEIIKYLSNNKVIIYFLLIDLIIAISMIPIDSYYSNYLNKLGMNELIIGLIICVQYVFSSITGILGNKITYTISVKSIINYFPCIMVLCFVIFSVSKFIFLNIFFYLLGLIIFSLFAPQKYKLLHTEINPSYRSSILSIQSLFMGLIATIIQPIYGFISEKIGLNIAFLILLIISLILLVINNFIFSNSLSTKLSKIDT